ncbi:MAG: PhzF family phenazine biosynthesis protein [Alphaproteobacteria bacterium]|nr:PhzF family phenazine biosynthesis protein [Alphaproteobacteria bacterium]
MISRKFFTLDVFTKTALAGNPLAVVLDSNGLSDQAMQSIAKEFNLSETVFVFPPEDQANRAALRIFTPAAELPFAGHPTVGTAVLMVLLDGYASSSFGLEEKVGPVACTASRISVREGEAIFTLPHLPERIAEPAPSPIIAEALGVAVDEIGFDDHRPLIASAGVGFNFVPLKSKDAVTRASIKGANWTEAFKAAGRPNAFIYTSEAVEAGHHFHARMFAPHLGISEDPATGSAVAAFARAFVDFEKPEDGTHRIVIEQGYAMGRPSQIALEMDIAKGALVAARIGGSAVIVSEGTLRV